MPTANCNAIARTEAKDHAVGAAQGVRHGHTPGQLYPAFMFLMECPAVHLGDGGAKMGMHAHKLHHVVRPDGVQEPLNNTSL